MLARDVQDILGTERDVAGDGWKSRRLVVADDGLKYSVHETILDAGITLRFVYSAHHETVYCIEGEGSVRNLSTGGGLATPPGVPLLGRDR
jgi:L-ectoine synthase